MMMTQRQKSRLINAPYKRLDKETESGSESGEETELFVRNKQKKWQMPTIEKVVKDGDTLQSLAIRYHCTIADLKRLNNIHKENEIFAKRTIKVPYRPFTMALAEVHISGTSSPDHSGNPSTSKLIDIDSFNSTLTDNLLKVSNNQNTEINEIIFNSNIDKPCDRLSDDVVEDDCEEVQLLPQSERRSSETQPVFSVINCNGANAGISWKVLVACIAILVFAIPLILVFYIVGHLQEYHPHIS